MGSNSKWKEFLRDGAVPMNKVSSVQNEVAAKTFKYKKSMMASSEDKRKSVPDIERSINKS